MAKYTDYDYDTIPIPDLTLDLHWIQLPAAVLIAQQKTQQAALEAERLAAQPDDHQVILVPADPAYAPKQGELWPIINHAIQSVLKSHYAVHEEVMNAIDQAIDQYRGWRNPYPTNLDYPDRPIKTKTRKAN